MQSVLYIIATPIGNLGDITLRALEVLKRVDTVLCEDTRVTKKLLSKYEISVPTLSYHEHSTLTKIEKIIEMLAEGKSLALVSDAGSPTISDPGSYLVAKVREALPELSIVSIPGPSALTASLSLSGLPASDFLFLGFLPHKKGRETLFKEIADSKRTAVFYESPHRIIKTLESLTMHVLENSSVNRTIVVAREITKIHEQVVSGSPQEVLHYFEEHPDKVRGEFVVMVSGGK